MSPKYPLMYNNITREGLDALIAYLQKDEPTSDFKGRSNRDSCQKCGDKDDLSRVNSVIEFGGRY